MLDPGNLSHIDFQVSTMVMTTALEGDEQSEVSFLSINLVCYYFVRETKNYFLTQSRIKEITTPSQISKIHHSIKDKGNNFFSNKIIIALKLS